MAINNKKKNHLTKIKHTKVSKFKFENPITKAKIFSKVIVIYGNLNLKRRVLFFMLILLEVILLFAGLLVGFGFKGLGFKFVDNEIDKPIKPIIILPTPTPLTTSTSLPIYPPSIPPKTPETAYVKMENNVTGGLIRYHKYWNGKAKTINLTAGTSSSDYIDINSRIIITFYNWDYARWDPARFSPKYALFGLRKINTTGQAATKKISCYDYYVL